MFACDIMTEKPVVISESATIKEALSLLKTSALHDLPIINADGHVIGEVNPHAILLHAMPGYAHDNALTMMKSEQDMHSLAQRVASITTQPVTTVMNQNIYTIQALSPLSAVVMMIAHIAGETQHLYVVDHDNTLLGTISARDILCHI